MSNARGRYVKVGLGVVTLCAYAAFCTALCRAAGSAGIQATALSCQCHPLQVQVPSRCESELSFIKVSINVA